MHTLYLGTPKESSIFTGSGVLEVNAQRYSEGFLLTPLAGHETDQVKHLRQMYVDSQEVAVDSYCPPRTNSWDLNTICRQVRNICRHILLVFALSGFWKQEPYRHNSGVAQSERAPLRFLLTPLVGHETDQVKHLRQMYVDNQEVAVDSYCPPRTNSWDLNTMCR
ncbi:hypothetical protein Taro_046591 [Colocasia esculenta]|uniref:Uncharacterized protein n=1 Tax=Colocasia esculenta TaxID=4460 RepID=A0A843X5S2_COLES|nr:hypothetical protein [Colocasia esculenta]